jgi:hypothetical protein
MDAPTYTPPPPDPSVTALKEQAKTDQISALQDTASIDTASLMARYGTRLAMAGSTSAPLATASPLVAGSGLVSPLVAGLAKAAG